MLSTRGTSGEYHELIHLLQDKISPMKNAVRFHDFDGKFTSSKDFQNKLFFVK